MIFFQIGRVWCSTMSMHSVGIGAMRFIDWAGHGWCWSLHGSVYVVSNALAILELGGNLWTGWGHQWAFHSRVGNCFGSWIPYLVTRASWEAWCEYVHPILEGFRMVDLWEYATPLFPEDSNIPKRHYWFGSYPSLFQAWHNSEKSGVGPSWLGRFDDCRRWRVVHLRFLLSIVDASSKRRSSCCICKWLCELWEGLKWSSRNAEVGHMGKCLEMCCCAFIN